ncbi:hypothetical protein BVG81_010090 [Haliangium sp. UPWRP_2]|nr:hypothetical protein BVG81_010090 [Haliangium sp. UPWRP_2]
MATAPQPEGTENSSKLFEAAPMDAPATAQGEAQTAVSTPAGRPPASSAAVRPEPRTIELYFVDSQRRRVPFRDAFRHRGDGLQVRSHITPALGLQPSDGVGLGGTPGRGPEFYRWRHPPDYGLGAKLMVLYWDDYDQRVYAADETLLEAALGSGWREKLRELCTGGSGAGQG